MSLTKKHTLSERFRYRLDNFMSKGGASVFLALLFLFFIAFVVMGAVRLGTFFIFPDEAIEDQGFLLWHAFFQIIDSGALAELDAQSNFAGKLVAILTIFVGLVLFSSMVAFITQEFERRLSILRKGKSLVLESDHILIVGFSGRVIEIIRELIVANESDSGVVVILADQDKEKMDDYIRENIHGFLTTRVITRSGSPTSLKNLQSAGIEFAHSVVILNDAKSSDDDLTKESADARVLKTIMAVVSAKGEEGVPPVVAEVHIDRYRILAQSIVEGKITTLNEAEILARMLVQTSRNEGLAMVYSDLVGFQGNEFYFYRPEGGWGALTFGALQYHFMESVPLGIRTPEGRIILNPPQDRVLQEEDDIVVLADDDSTIDFSKTPAVTPEPRPYSTLRHTLLPENHLVVGWNNKAPIVLREYAAYMTEGSSVNLLIEQGNNQVIRKTFEEIAAHFPRIQMTLNEIDFHSQEELTALNLPIYTTVSILAGSGEEAEEIDAKTIMRLLQIRHLFQEHERATGEEITTKLITEIVNSENTELVVQVGVKDFLISNQFVSRIFAQIAVEADVMRVYEDLFSEEGSEVYVKHAELYFDFADQEEIEVSFGECVLAAQQRREVCFGIKLVREQRDAAQLFGIHVIPRKDRSFRLCRKDALIVLAEDES